MVLAISLAAIVVMTSLHPLVPEVFPSGTLIHQVKPLQERYPTDTRSIGRVPNPLTPGPRQPPYIPYNGIPYNSAIAIDTQNDQVFVVEESWSYVAIVNGTDLHVIAELPITQRGNEFVEPDAAMFDPINHDVYVADYMTGNLTVIYASTDSVAGTISVGYGPDALVLDPVNGWIYVATDYAVVVVNGWDNRVINNISLPVPNATTTLGGPAATVYDSNDSQLYVDLSSSYDGRNSGGVVAISPLNDSSWYLGAIGSDPRGMAYDPDDSKLFLADWYSGSLTALAASTGNPIGSVAAGDGSESVVFDPFDHDAYVTNSESWTMTVVNASSMTAVRTATVMPRVSSVEVDPLTGLVYASNGSTLDVLDPSSISVIKSVSVTPVFDFPAGPDLVWVSAVSFLVAGVGLSFVTVRRRWSARHRNANVSVTVGLSCMSVATVISLAAVTGSNSLIVFAILSLVGEVLVFVGLSGYLFKYENTMNDY